MKFCFIAEDAKHIHNVYPDYVKEQLKSEFGEDEALVFKKSDVLANSEQFSELEYIFSTWSMPTFEEDEIRKYFPRLRAVMYAAGSVQYFARPFLACGVSVFSAWSANAIPVAEVALAHILLANKGYHMASYHFSKGRSHRQKAMDYVVANRGNFNCKVGILGIGMIGTEICKLLKRHRLTVLAFDPFCPQEKAKELGIELTTLERIFSECEVISNHLANNAQTKGILDYKLFSLMHDNATFINTGRGAQVVESDLVRALSEKPYACAVLDVTDPEPPVADSPLYDMENVILTPHLAGSQRNECWRMAEYMLDEATAHRHGKETRFEVSLKMLETMA